MLNSKNVAELTQKLEQSQKESSIFHQELDNVRQQVEKNNSILDSSWIFIDKKVSTLKYLNFRKQRLIVLYFLLYGNQGLYQLLKRN